MDNKELVKNIQGLTYNMLKDIDAYCKQNNILYFLSGGSCLGAVRHKGFIPWDDDIDIMLPREDYEKFLKGFNEYKTNKYQVGSLYTDIEWKRPYARIWDKETELKQKTYDERQMGVFIDVFPIDGLPQNKLLRWIHYRHVKVLNSMRVACIRKAFNSQEKYVIIKRLIIDPLFHGKSAREYAEKTDNVAKKHLFSKSYYVGVILALHYWDRETIEKDLMDKAVLAEFEDDVYPIPVGYEIYLKNLYGDYMKIPEDAAEKGYSHLDGWEITIHSEEEEKNA